ncbi:hypothetical protein F4810DRAFT_705590 [Camillea tinctor]|nr:hypothetical protein F4810DRAFT_705590 [Camillea tinctor]
MSDAIDILSTDVHGFKDYDLDFHMRLMDRVYNFSPYYLTDPHDFKPADLPIWIGHKGRNLWTDALGVLNFISFQYKTRNLFFGMCAMKLVESVHNVLGKTRDSTRRLGLATAAHPLNGGLRTGTKLAHGSFNRDFGYMGESQDFFGLSLWMYALNRLSLATNMPMFNGLAMELAQAVYPLFAHELDNQGAMPRWLSPNLGMIYIANCDGYNRLVSMLAATVIQDTQKLNRWFVKSPGNRQKPENTPLHGAINGLIEDILSRPGFLQYPDKRQHLDIYLSTENLRELALFLFVGFHGDDRWSFLVFNSAAGALEHYLRDRVSALHGVHIDRPGYGGSMELLLIAIARCYVKRDSQDERLKDMEPILVQWRELVTRYSKGIDVPDDFPAHVYVSYVAAQMNETFSFGSSTLQWLLDKKGRLGYFPRTH